MFLKRKVVPIGRAAPVASKGPLAPDAELPRPRYDGVPQRALKLPARLGNTQATVRELAIEALKISAGGLARRNRRNKSGVDERVFLDPLIESAEANQTPAERKLALYEGPWAGDIDRIFSEFQY